MVKHLNGTAESLYGFPQPTPNQFPVPISARRNPTTLDTGYIIGQIWVNRVTGTVYCFAGVAGGIATWATLGGAGADVNTLSDDAATPIAPIAGNIQIVGGTNVATVSGAGTLTVNLDNQIELGSVECGTIAAPGIVYATNNAAIQAVVDDNTAAGASTRKALYGQVNTTSGNGNSIVSGIEGELITETGSNVLMVVGTKGYLQQDNGSIITSTAAGVEGHLNLLETNNADLPTYAAFGVKGYLDSTDAAGVPGAMTSGVGSIIEYNTPFNAKAYGYVASRLDTPGGSAGTAAQAAYGVLQGTNAIADWLYGLDLYNGAAGVDYTNADIRLWNQALINSSAAGVLFSSVAGDNWTFQMGDAVGANKTSFTDSTTKEVAAISSLGVVTCRSVIQQNTNIPSINVSPILQSALNTGVAPTGATGDTNIMYLQDGVTMQQFILGAGQTIIAPRLVDDGLLISLDLTATEGAEYYFGHSAMAKHRYVIGTSPAFFVEATFKVADCGTSDPLWLGFRLLGVPNAAYTAYTDAATIGLRNTTAADVVVQGNALNGGAWNYLNSTDAWLDGGVHTLRVNVSAAGVVTYLIDGVAPTAPLAFTFDNGDTVIPFIHHLFAAAGAPAAINLRQFACGLQ